MTHLSSEKESLGDILYDKVEEVLKPAHVSYTSIITGMLLERSPDEITSLLGDSKLLKRSVVIALQVLSEDRQSTCQTKNELARWQTPSPHSHEEIGDLLFEKVSAITEPCVTPYVTGMILELGHDIVADIVKDENKLRRAVEKAKNSFMAAFGVDSLESLPAISFASVSSPDSNESTSEVQHKEERLCNEGCEGQQKEEFGLQIFQRAEALYKDHAPEISGMILEMDCLSLQRIVADEVLLDEAIAKSHAALLTQTRCAAL